MDRLKIIISSWSVFPFHGMGGIEKFPFYLARNLAREGVDVEIVTSRDRKKRRTEVYEGLKYTFLPPMCAWRRLLGPWIQLFNFNLAKYLRKQEFHVLHSFTNTAYFYLHSQQRNPTLIQPFGLEPFWAPSLAGARGLKRLYLNTIIRNTWRYCLTHADAVACETEDHRQELIRFGIDKDRIFHLPQGVEVAQIQAKARQAKLSIKDLRGDQGEIVLLMVYRFWRDTGMEYALQALALLKQKSKGARLILIGKAESPTELAYYQEIRHKIADLGLSDSVVCLKNVPEDILYGYYPLADIFVSPNIRSNRLLISIQEAMACGLPIVSTGQEALVKAGVNGYIVPPGDPEAMAAAVWRIHTENRYQEFGARSRELVAEYDLKNIARKAIQKYEELARRQGAQNEG